MKTTKILITLLISIIGFSAYADELTAEQLRFRNNIEQFLREEGFSPSIDDSDNSVMFKKEGVLHWITVAGSGAFYIEFFRSGLKIESDDNREAMLDAVNYANLKTRCAKAIVRDTQVTLAVEMFCHSAEEFRYVFYKCLDELATLRNYVKERYNNGSSSSYSSNSYSSQSTALSAFFPIYGMTLGRSTHDDARRAGYIIKESGTSRYCDVNTLAFWDHNEDGVFESIYTTDSDMMPDAWQSNFGFSWLLSYNQWKELFEKYGFTINVTEYPTTKEFSGRNTLSAEFVATSSDGTISFELDFDYGNDNGEGYSVNARNSLYSIRVKSLR